jgi:hypothetical protein
MDEHPTDHPLVDSDGGSDAVVDRPRARRGWLIAAVSVGIVIVAVGVALYVAASHYQPLFQGLSGGYGARVLTSDGSLATSRVSGAGDTDMVWTEPSGTFRVEALITINDVQRFGVTIDKVMAPPNPSGNTEVRVFFDSTKRLIGAYGYKGGPAFQPTSLASGGQLQLSVHWTQQCVPASAQSGVTTYKDLPVEYSFMGFHHTVTVPIQTLTIAPRQTC